MPDYTPVGWANDESHPLSESNMKTLDAGIEQAHDTRVKKSGDTMTGQLTLPGNPTASGHAARKAYVDGLVAFQQIINDAPDSALGATLGAVINTTTVTLPSGWGSMRVTVGGYIGWYTTATEAHTRVIMQPELPAGTVVGQSRFDSRDPGSASGARHGTIPMDAAPTGTFSADTSVRVQGNRAVGPSGTQIWRRYLYVMKFRLS